MRERECDRGLWCVCGVLGPVSANGKRGRCSDNGRVSTFRPPPFWLDGYFRTYLSHAVLN